MQSMYVRIEDVGDNEAMLTFGGIRDNKESQKFYTVLPLEEGQELMKELALKIIEATGHDIKGIQGVKGVNI